MSTTQATYADTDVRIHADHGSEKRLGNWTTARAFQVRARHGSVVIDLRSPQIPEGDIEVELDVDHSTIKLLVPEDAVIDQWNLTWASRGKVKQTFHHNPVGAGRRIRLIGRLRHSEMRVHSGGIARLSAILTWEFLADARFAHAEGRVPTLDDPARSA
jgi:hypothetical protein